MGFATFLIYFVIDVPESAHYRPVDIGSADIETTVDLGGGSGTFAEHLC